MADPTMMPPKMWTTIVRLEAENERLRQFIRGMAHDTQYPDRLRTGAKSLLAELERI